jgi:4Fe-4S single cluster domain
VFDLIRARFDRAGLAEAPYRPLRIEFELTTKCNDSCPSCGMGALPLTDGTTLTLDRRARMVDEFDSVGLPSVAITGGEPFTAAHTLYPLMTQLTARGIEVSKLTTNGLWGSESRCARTFDRLERTGWLGTRLFVPLLMVSIGEQATPLDWIARIIREGVTRYTGHEMNIAVSSLADPATRTHRVYDLIRAYEQLFGDFPHDRVHSTMRVYLDNDRLEEQKPVSRPGHTTVARWMDACYDCFAPTVGTYILPTALLKLDGRVYSCAAFNVPERLAFGNLWDQPLRAILTATNRDAYVQAVRDGGGLKGLHGHVPQEFTAGTACDSFCGSCSLLIGEFDRARGAASPVLIPAESITTRPGAQ